jgi:thiol-disulfide isomerase/thioredoxin
MRCCLPTLLLLGVLATPLGLSAQTQPAPDLPAAAASAYAQGLEAERDQQFDVALDRFTAAAKAAPGSQLCLMAVARTQSEMSDDKAAFNTATKMIASAAIPETRAQAERFEGQLYYREWASYTDGTNGFEKNAKKADESLRRSEALLARAAADAPGDEPLHMMHAHVLAVLHRDADASHEFAACAAIAGTSPAECARALKLSTDATLARFEPAPQFKLTTMDGKPLTLDALAGKVVLVDFWGSWCRYCVRDMDYIQSMLDSFDAQHFVLLEVNVGDSAERWKSYVAAKRMHGVQVHDEHEQLQQLFHVRAFPTYVILDGDGIIHYRTEGDRGDLRGEIRALIQSLPTGHTATTTTASASTTN